MAKSGFISIVTRTVVALLLVGLAAYPADWVVWRLRVAAGGGMSQTQVSHFTVAELKGGKETYYYDGTSAVDCSLSLFPEAGSGPCWWLARHPQVVDRY